MISTFKQNKITWIDLECPTAEEVKSLMQKYSIHPLVAEELLKPTIRPKVDVYKNFIYLIMHFPVFEQESKTSISYEIDFIIGKNFLITAHYKPITPLYELTKVFEVGSILGKDNMIKNPGLLVFFIIRQLYNFALRQLDHIQLKINNIEDNIFKGREAEMVEVISCVRRDTLDFQRSIYGHESILNSLELSGKEFFGQDFVHYINNISGELARVKNILNNCKETMESLQSTNDSLLTDKTNDIMRFLATLSFLTFPMMLLTALFSMGTVSTPILGIKGDFWIIVGIIILSITTMLIWFKQKKWI
ncbi:MAG: hypothetical protein HY773_02105 [Candidatus Terrybacteria bacterium]|nr:hypothetical protein [Candidatus Terrybacteria bacterium]